ncbi:conserved hypothetical protein [Candidatus Terasakiella magnetica]|nr:conserved hypothetical protein [Candidatus Terasakiella magnetica]
MAIDGFYSIQFGGAAGAGIGILVVHNGKVVGIDAGGVAYDGSASPTPGGNVGVNLLLNVPAGVHLVQGVVKPQPWQLPINVVVPEASLGNGQPLAVGTPVGPVNVVIKKLRDF